MTLFEQNSSVVSLADFRGRDLSPRQRQVLARIRGGAQCGTCGDMGFVDGRGRGMPCWSCGRRGRDDIGVRREALRSVTPAVRIKPTKNTIDPDRSPHGR